MQQTMLDVLESDRLRKLLKPGVKVQIEIQKDFDNTLVKITEVESGKILWNDFDHDHPINGGQEE